jgi:hypothetical protein
VHWGCYYAAALDIEWDPIKYKKMQKMHREIANITQKMPKMIYQG